MALTSHEQYERDQDMQILVMYGACALVSEKMAEAVDYDQDKLTEWGWKWEEDGNMESGPGEPYLVNPHMVEPPLKFGCPECHEAEGGSRWDKEEDMPQREVVEDSITGGADPTSIYKLTCDHWVM